MKWEIDADACAFLHCPAVGRPFAEQANDLVNVEMAGRGAMPTVALAAMGLIVGFCLEVAIVPFASIAVALTSIAGSVDPSHLVDYVAFYSYLFSMRK